jgi:hypothetical protein
VLGALALFVLLIVLAARSYSGGTFYDPGAPGFSFWGNYWCDLLESPALSGAPNTVGQQLARAAFLAFAVAMAQFWSVVEAALRSLGRPLRTVRAGQLGALCLLGLAFVPPYEHPLAHGALVLLGGVPSLAASAVLAVSPPLRRDVPTGVSALACVGASALCLTQYVLQGLRVVPAAQWVPGAQKCATVALVAFMLTSLRRLSSLQRA